MLHLLTLHFLKVVTLSPPWPLVSWLCTLSSKYFHEGFKIHETMFHHDFHLFYSNIFFWWVIFICHLYFCSFFFSFKFFNCGSGPELDSFWFLSLKEVGFSWTSCLEEGHAGSHSSSSSEPAKLFLDSGFYMRGFFYFLSANGERQLWGFSQRKGIAPSLLLLIQRPKVAYWYKDQKWLIHVIPCLASSPQILRIKPSAGKLLLLAQESLSFQFEHLKSLI